MAKYINVSKNGGRSILVEVADERTEKGLLKPADVIDKIDKEFTDLVQNEILTNCEILAGAFEKLKATNDPPSGASVEFGLQFNAEGNIYLVKASAEASYKVSIDWKWTKE